MALLVDGQYWDIRVFYLVKCRDGLCAWNVYFKISLVYLGQAQVMPKQAVASMSTYGRNFAWWCGLLDGLRVPYLTTRPSSWMKGLVPKKKKKSDKPGLKVARKMFPTAPLTLSKHHGRADSILLAYAAFNEMKGGLYACGRIW